MAEQENSVLSELRKRKVFQTAAVYGAVAWGATEIIVTVVDQLFLPQWVATISVIGFVLGFPVAMFLAWTFDITPDGIQRTAVRSRRGTASIAGSLLLLIAATAGLFVLINPAAHDRAAGTQSGAGAPAAAPAATTAEVAEKSIAVLPFENLSSEAENAYFADGVQDEILTDLAKIADLKVISRTSVLQYKTGPDRNLREIGQQLGVAHLLEGSVQRAGGKVRVNARLIDARTDTQLWAQRYDRDLADVFAIQSEVAQAIAEQLRAELSPMEESAIQERPTKDITAFDLYSEAKTLVLNLTSSSVRERKLGEAVNLLNRAIARDPSFFAAQCLLVDVHGQFYLYGIDHTPARLASAQAAVDAAIRLRPDAGEAHLARATLLYRGYLDYDGALAELAIARRTLPNSPDVSQFAGFIARRRGQQEEAVRQLERSLELDPRSFFTIQQLAISYRYLRRYRDAGAVLDRALSIRPDDVSTRVGRALVEFDWKADTGPLHRLIQDMLREDPESIKEIAADWFSSALAERDAASAERALAAIEENSWAEGSVILSRAWGEGVLARMEGDEARAKAAFTAARAEHEKQVMHDPNYGPGWSVLGVIDAGLGRKEEALREGRRAMELLPVEKDAVNGAVMIKLFALTAAWASEKDLAIEYLEKSIPLFAPITYGRLKLYPIWDPLRGDPRFEKIVADLAPKQPSEH